MYAIVQGQIAAPQTRLTTKDERLKACIDSIVWSSTSPRPGDGRSAAKEAIPYTITCYYPFICVLDALETYGYKIVAVARDSHNIEWTMHKPDD